MTRRHTIRPAIDPDLADFESVRVSRGEFHRRIWNANRTPWVIEEATWDRLPKGLLVVVSGGRRSVRIVTW